MFDVTEAAVVEGLRLANNGSHLIEAERGTLAEARRRALVVLDRVMTITHVDDPTCAELLQCQARAQEIRAAVLLDPKGLTAERAAAIMEKTPAFSALLTLIAEQLDDEKFAVELL